MFPAWRLKVDSAFPSSITERFYCVLSNILSRVSDKTQGLDWYLDLLNTYK
jgi:hypothetical protein